MIERPISCWVKIKYKVKAKAAIINNAVEQFACKTSKSYSLSVKPSGNILSITVTNGDGLPKAFVAKIEFRDKNSCLIPEPYNGFSVSSKVGSYCYVKGGRPNSPRRTERKFDAPLTAASIRIVLLPWKYRSPPKLRFPPLISDGESLEGIRLDLLRDLSIPSLVSYKLAPITDRICYVLHNSLPHSTGGYATRAQGLARGIQTQGFEVIGITRPGFPLDAMKVDRDDASHHWIDGVRYHRLCAPWRKDKNIHEYMQICVAEYEGIFRDLRPVAVLGASFYYSAMPSMIAARRLGLPYIYEVRGLAELTKASRDTSYSKSASFAESVQMDTATCMVADHVFTLTRGMESILIDRGVPAKKISIASKLCQIPTSSKFSHGIANSPRDTTYPRTFRW